MRPPGRILASTVCTAALLLAPAAHAATTPEESCQKARYKAAAKFTACEQKATGAFYGGFPLDKFKEAITKCRVKYSATWPKLEARASGTGATCDNPRLADNGDGTVTDRLTGLQWEQKTDDASVHDQDNFYCWSEGGAGYTAEDGTAYTGLLATLNGGACFAGQCDWRLPTLGELLTALELFGPTLRTYWSATTFAPQPEGAWYVYFANGDLYGGHKGFDFRVRAVRGGL